MAAGVSKALRPVRAPLFHPGLVIGPAGIFFAAGALARESA